MLKATGKVIQIGIDNKGNTKRYLLSFLIVVVKFVVVVDMIFSSDTKPPTKGSIPKGSGDDRSLNQSIPSVRIAGLMS